MKYVLEDYYLYIKLRGKSMSNSEKIIIKENKVLKLNNLLIREVTDKEFEDFDKITFRMDSYIKSKGTSTIGPMINYYGVEIDEIGQPKASIKIMVQLKNPIRNVESPYKIKDQIKVRNCIFARFNEKEQNLQYAYQKLHVYAFENNIKLKGDSYTVFVKHEDENLVADVFMETVKS